MRFNQLLESIAASERFIAQQFDHGQSVRSMASRRGPQYQKGLAEAVKFIADVFDGRRPMWQLKEALSTSDFPLLFGDTIDRMMVAKYQSIPPTWRDYVRVSTVNDFRAVKRFKCTRGASRLHGPMGQGESYEADAVQESSYSFAVAKFGRRRDVLWEALVNDDLDALKDAPDDLAYQAINTEVYEVTRLFAGNTTLYGNHTVEGEVYSNKGTAAFSADALAAAVGAMSEYPDDDGESPIMNDPVYITVATRAMQLKVEQVLNSLIVAYTGSTDRDNLPTANIISQELRSRLQVRYNPWIRLFDASYATAWYLFADPALGWAIEFAFLRGHETPELFMKNSNQVLLGGGMSNPMDGDFDNDAVSYKARHVCGGSHSNAVGGWRFTYRSDGTA